MFARKILAASLCVLLIFSLSGCSKKRPEIEPADGWYATWAASALNAGSEQIPMNPELSGNTCRQQIRTSIGGDKIRLTFSNEYGSGSVKFDSVRLAQLTGPGSPEINPETDIPVTFNGSTSVTVKAGDTVTSDELSFSFDPLDYLAVTIKFGDAPASPTCHRESGCTSWIVEGDHVSDQTFDSMELMSSWYFLCRADTWAAAGTETLVCFGDSVTDYGRSTYNGFNSWPEALSTMLRNDTYTNHISVVNSAISGNAISGGTGPSGKDRFKRDVLDIPGVHSVIILIGANDIPSAQYDTSQEIISQYKEMISACHELGISIYAGTLTPFGGNTLYYSELHEKIRTAVNAFIMSEDSGFDGYIDFSEVLCRAENPSVLQQQYDCGDGLNPNASGCDVMAKAAAELVRVQRGRYPNAD